MNYSRALSERLGTLRRLHGLTQEQLAASLGVSYQAVSKWENEHSSPDLSLLPIIADLFGITLDELFGRAQGGVDLRQGLIAEYLFSGNARDSSGNEWHGRVHGATLCDDRFGRPESAYYFDGKDDYLIVDPPPRLNDQAFSLSVWCYYDVTTNLKGWHSALVSQDGHQIRRIFQLSTRDESITFHRFLREPDLCVETPLQKGSWYHIAVTYADGLFRLYCDGRLESEQEGVLTLAEGESLYVGRKSTEEQYFYFHGKLDDLRLYARALSADEVSALCRENGWRPASRPAAVAERAVPVLEAVEDVQIAIAKREIRAAVAWYREHLGFHPLIEHDGEFYLLTLYDGPNLLVHGTEDRGEGLAPCIFRTRRDLDTLRGELSAVGASAGEVRDEGFAHFMDFQDPFGQNWTVMREKR